MSCLCDLVIMTAESCRVCYS